MVRGIEFLFLQRCISCSSAFNLKGDGGDVLFDVEEGGWPAATNPMVDLLMTF